MATPPDWIKAAAEEISGELAGPDIGATREATRLLMERRGELAAIIAKHAPPAPRCETCRHWNDRTGDGLPLRSSWHGVCGRGIGKGGVTLRPKSSLVHFDSWEPHPLPADFGCVEHEPREKREP